MEVEIKNIYLTIFLIALFICLLKLIDTNILSFHTKLEGFVSESPKNNKNNKDNKVSPAPSEIINTIAPVSSSPEESKYFKKTCKSSDIINNMSFLHETEKKVLSIEDFYPSLEMS